MRKSLKIYPASLYICHNISYVSFISGFLESASYTSVSLPLYSSTPLYPAVCLYDFTDNRCGETKNLPSYMTSVVAKLYYLLLKLLFSAFRTVLSLGLPPYFSENHVSTISWIFFLCSVLRATSLCLFSFYIVSWCLSSTLKPVTTENMMNQGSFSSTSELCI